MDARVQEYRGLFYQKWDVLTQEATVQSSMAQKAHK